MRRFGPDDLTVIIPTRSRWHILAQTLEALAHQTVSGFDTLVVVDGDDEPVPDMPQAARGVKVLVKKHGGPGAARNAGVAATAAPLVLFLGDDMIPTPRLVERHLARHLADPDDHVAVLGHVDWHPSLAGDRIASWLDWSNTQFDYRLITTEDAGFGRFFSCNVSLKRAFFTAAGGFDEDFTYYYEDLDCGWRLNEHGLVLRYDREAVAHHLHRYTWEGIEARFEGIARGERLMQRKHPDFEPWFARRVHGAADAPPVSLVWPLVVDWIPPQLGPLRGRAEHRADLAYYKALAPLWDNAWAADRSFEELREYLGDRFDESRLYQHRHIVDEEEEAASDEATFYKTSEAYLYDLTAFASWRTKLPYVQALRRAIPRGASVLDYGCGIGSDGLRLIDAGYRVTFADFDNPSTRYLRWRLAHRGIDAQVCDVEGEVPGGFDAAFSFDVIEHVEDPWDFLDRLERRATVVAVNLLEDDPADTHLHKPLPIAEMLDHAAGLGLVWYRKYYGRSHLMVYRTDHAVPAARSRAERRLGGRRREVSVNDLARLDRLRVGPLVRSTR